MYHGSYSNKQCSHDLKLWKLRISITDNAYLTNNNSNMDALISFTINYILWGGLGQQTSNELP